MWDRLRWLLGGIFILYGILDTALSLIGLPSELQAFWEGHMQGDPWFPWVMLAAGLSIVLWPLYSRMLKGILMTSKENAPKSLGDISVSMDNASGVRIGDIGHKVTFHEPLPSPNAIYQNDVVVGELGAQHQSQDGNMLCPKLLLEESFDKSQPFVVQGVQMQIKKFDFEAYETVLGRPTIGFISNALCEVLEL